MHDVVIVDAVRTPVGKRNGVLSRVHAVHLAAQPMLAVLERTGLDPALVDQVLYGCVDQVGEQAANIGRLAWLHAGLPIEVPASTVDFQCGSSQQTIHLAAGLIASGAADVVLAGGVESMSRVPMWSNYENGPGTPFTPALLDRFDLASQGISAERMAAKWNVSRQEADAFSLTSHQKAAHARACGWFGGEIVPVETTSETGQKITVTHDEGIRPDADLAKMGTLKTVFKEDGIVTAANSSQISDGAAALLLMSREKATGLGLKARARIVAQTVVGTDPELMLSGPIPATQKVLARAGLTLEQIDLVEINEAFASVVLAWQKEFQADMSKVNIHGGAIAIGHPLGASGSRLMATLLHALERTGGRFGLQTMCCAGGMGTGTIIERLD